jgi:hypothetical protein
MAKKTITFTPSVFDDFAKMDVSPEKLPSYLGDSPCAEVDAAYDALELEPTTAEFYRAIGVLVFHARHLLPHQHADLARIVATPYVRPAGKPANVKLRQAAEDFVEAKKSGRGGETRKSFMQRATREFRTSKAIVSRALRDAERRAQLLRK